jgi:general stress protein 26
MVSVKGGVAERVTERIASASGSHDDCGGGLKMDQNKDGARIWSLIEGIGIAMVVTHAGDALRARPMAARPEQSDNAIYFLTDTDAPKDNEIRDNDAICLAFADVKKNHYVSVTGRGEIVDDRAKIKQHWSTFDKAFWRDADDPAIRLLRVRPDRAEYWETAGAVVTVVKMIAAGLAGERPSLGDNEKVSSFKSSSPS